MKLILKAEVDNLGLPGDVVDVADGYGRNYLLPRGLALLATPGAMKEAEALTRARKAREAKTVGSAKASAEVLEARTLRIPVRVDDRGGLLVEQGRRRLAGGLVAADVGGRGALLGGVDVGVVDAVDDVVVVDVPARAALLGP